MDKDIRGKNCLSDNERYADLINGLLLEGEQIVKAKIYMVYWILRIFLRN